MPRCKAPTRECISTALRTLIALTLLALLGLAQAALTPTARAQRTGFVLDRFRPAPTSEDGLALVLPRTLGHLQPGFGLTLDYAHRPLVLAQADREEALVEHRLVGHVTAALGLGSRFELFLRAPMLYVQRGEERLAVSAQPLPEGAAFGSLHAGASLRLLGADDGPLSLGISSWIEAPTGDRARLIGDDGVSAGGLLTAASHTHLVSFAINVGGRYRPSLDSPYARVGSELLLGAGAYLYAHRRVTLLGELAGAVSLRDWGEVTTDSTPLEVLLGLRVATPIELALTFGGGYGLTGAVGVPGGRALVQIAYPAPRKALVAPDSDGDGLRDPRDRCPSRREDLDGFEDGDGCPDLDNDKDGTADKSDACPRDPEDRDGFEDADGCPDLDNDKDGIADGADRCPNAVEDRDGFEDEDGCADLDNDKDNLLDLRDQCPNEPEDPDGFADEDGCADPDNDKDGVLDIDDECPTAPGEHAAKGCPTKVRVERDQIRILDRVEFPSNRAELQPESLSILDQVRSVLEVNPQIRRLRIEGHTDDRGPNARNKKLSQRRAEAVMKYLVRAGIDPARLSAQGWGEERPLVNNDSAENRQTNRRVEFHIVDAAPLP